MLQLNTIPPFLQLNPQKKDERYKLPLLKERNEEMGIKAWQIALFCQGLTKPYQQSRATTVSVRAIGLRVKALLQHLEKAMIK